jgi:hypothetical protein
MGATTEESMRTSLTRALAGTAITGAAVLAAVGTAAAAGATTKAPTTLTATASKATITLGQTDKITGTLLTGSKPVPGKVVYLEREVKGKFIPAEVDLTGGAGHVFFTVKPHETTHFMLLFKGNAKFAAAHSNIVTIVVTKPTKVPTTLTATAAKSTIAPGDSDLITGTLMAGSKAVPGKAVILEKLIAGKFVPVQADLTGGAGHVFYTVKPAETAHFMLVFRGTPAFGASHSDVVTIVVAKLPTTLTATAASSSITAGQTDKITGTLLSGTTAVAGKVVYLEKEVSGKFVPVEVDLTGGAGHVFFTVKPSATTTYMLVFKGTKVYDASHSDAVTIVVS